MRNIQLDHAAHRASAAKLPLRILAQDIALAANVGALFRIADALGVQHLHLCGTCPVPPDVRIRKTARSADRHVDWSWTADAMSTVAELKAAGWRLISLELSSQSVDVRTLAVGPQDRLCLVLGAEDAGVSQPLLDASDATVHIPMRGHNSSMNVATACAIATFELMGRLTSS